MNLYFPKQWMETEEGGMLVVSRGIGHPPIFAVYAATPKGWNYIVCVGIDFTLEDLWEEIGFNTTDEQAAVEAANEYDAGVSDWIADVAQGSDLIGDAKMLSKGELESTRTKTSVQQFLRLLIPQLTVPQGGRDE